MGEMTWRSAPGITRLYYVVGPWTGGKFLQMDVDVSMDRDLHRCRIELPVDGHRDFQIVANQNWNMRIYPQQPGATPGEVLACGPDRKGKDKFWHVAGVPFQTVEVMLDLDVEDFFDMVL